MPSAATSHRRSSGSHGDVKRKHRGSDKAGEGQRHGLSRKDSKFDQSDQAGATVSGGESNRGLESQVETTTNLPSLPQNLTSEAGPSTEDLDSLDISSFLAQRSQGMNTLFSLPELDARLDPASPLLRGPPSLRPSMVDQPYRAEPVHAPNMPGEGSVPARAPSPPPAVRPQSFSADLASSLPPPQPSVLQAQRTYSGYDHLSWTLSHRPLVLRPLYRSFKHLHHRLLLHLQDELAELEDELRHLDSEIRSHYSSRPTSRRFEDRAEGPVEDLYGRRERLFKAVQARLTAYQEIVRDLKAWKTDFIAPDEDARQDYKNWLNKNSALAEEETQFLDSADLVDIGSEKVVNESAKEEEIWPSKLATSLQPQIIVTIIVVILLPSFSWRVVALATFCLLLQSLPMLLKARAVVQELLGRRKLWSSPSQSSLWMIGGALLIVAVAIGAIGSYSSANSNIKSASVLAPATVTVTTTIKTARSYSPTRLPSRSTIPGHCPPGV